MIGAGRAIRIGAAPRGSQAAIARVPQSQAAVTSLFSAARAR